MEPYTLNLSTHKKSEVDLRVAQELKNNQDFIYQTNQSLQGLNHAIISLSLQHERVIAKTDSEKKDILIDFEKICDKVNKKLHQIDQRIGDLETKCNKDVDDIKFIINEMMRSYITTQTFSQQISILNNRIKEVCDLIEKHIDATASANGNIYNRIQSEIKKVRSDLTPIIPEVDPVKKAIDERMEILKVDFDGLVREIAILKKAVAYDEKKFENIYTLIDRLKAGKQ